MTGFSPLLTQVARFVCCSGIVAAALTGLATSAEYLVSPDGTGDYPTLQAAHDAAAPGDTLLLSNGRFSGEGNRHLLMDKNIMIRSQHGDPDSCIIDCQNERIAVTDWGTAQFQDIGFRHTRAAAASMSTINFSFCVFDSCYGISSWNELGSIHVEDCLITNCTNGPLLYNDHVLRTVFHSNSAILVVATGVGGAHVDQCLFENNEGSALILGGDASGWDCICRVTDCEFLNNQADALVKLNLSFIRADRCLCLNNEGSFVHFHDYLGISDLGIEHMINNSTFVGGRAESGVVFKVVDEVPETSQDVWIHECLVAFSEGGELITPGPLGRLDFDLECCDIYGNAGGDWVGVIAEQYGIDGNISLDPLFCGLTGQDLHLQDTSPCSPYSPPNSECALIGALPVGCSFSAIDDPPDSPECLRLMTINVSPHPSAGRVCLSYALDADEAGMPVHMRILSPDGRVISTIEGAAQRAGQNQLVWDGRADNSAYLPSGTYFYDLRTGRRREWGRLMLVR
jgi:FlgD Ig-like domain